MGANLEKLAGRLTCRIRRIRRKSAEQLVELAAQTETNKETLLKIRPDVCRAMTHPDAFIRAAALDILGYYRKDDTRDLIDAYRACLRDADEDVRRNAADALRVHGAHAAPAIPELIPMLHSVDDRERHAAASALHDMGTAAAPAKGVLLEMLQHRDGAVRFHGTLALGAMRLEPVEGIPLFTGLLEDTDGAVIRNAILALERYGQEAAPAVPKLTALVADKEHGREAIELLGKLGPVARAALPALKAALATQADLRAAEALWRIARDPEPILPVLRKHLFESKSERASDLAYRIGPPARELVPALVHALQDDDWDTQWAAACALGAIGPDAAEAVPALVEALTRGGGRVLDSSAHALGRVGQASVPALLSALRREEQPACREWILDALGQTGPAAAEALPEIRAFLASKDKRLCDWAAIAHARIAPHSPAPVEALAAMLADPDAPAEYAADALGGMGPAAKPAVPALEAMLTQALESVDPSREPHIPGIGSLALLGERGDLEQPDRIIVSGLALLRILRDPAFFPVLRLAFDRPYASKPKVDAMRAIAEIGPAAKAFTDDLLKLVHDDELEVREWAAAALKSVARPV